MKIKELRRLLGSFEDHDDLEYLNAERKWVPVNYDEWDEERFVRVVGRGDIRHPQREDNRE